MCFKKHNEAVIGAEEVFTDDENNYPQFKDPENEKELDALKSLTNSYIKDGLTKVKAMSSLSSNPSNRDDSSFNESKE